MVPIVYSKRFVRSADSTTGRDSVEHCTRLGRHADNASAWERQRYHTHNRNTIRPAGKHTHTHTRAIIHANIYYARVRREPLISRANCTAYTFFLSYSNNNIKRNHDFHRGSGNTGFGATYRRVSVIRGRETRAPSHAYIVILPKNERHCSFERFARRGEFRPLRADNTRTARR